MDFIIILGLLVLNGIFSMYEFALVSSSKPRLRTMANKGNSKAQKVLKLLEEPEKIFSATQVGITLISIISGAFGGVALAGKLAPFLERIAFLAPYAASASLVITVVLITYLSLVIGELVPKSIALNNPEKIAMTLSPFMIVLSKVLYPFVWILSVSTRFINNLLGIKSKGTEAMTEEELKYILSHSSEQGMIEKEETQIIKDVFRFTDKKASELMTHRGDVIMIGTDMPRQKVLDIVKEHLHSRYPLYTDTEDEIVGIVSVKDMLPLFDDSSKPFDLTTIAKLPLFIPDNMLANKVLDVFRQQKTNIGIVVSEYGTVEGLLTLVDLAESILGDMPDGSEDDEMIVPYKEDGQYLVDGIIHIEDLMDFFGITNYDDIKDKGFTTLGGLAMYILDKIPHEGDTFEYKNLSFDVIDMDNSRVDKLLVTQNKS